MNAWLSTPTLIPWLGLIPLGAAVSAAFMQRDPARVRVTREDIRRDPRRRPRG